MSVGDPGPVRTRGLLGVVLGAGAAVRLHDLGVPSTWTDELYRLVWAKGYEVVHFFGVLPSETGARLPPLGLRRALQVANAHTPPLYEGMLNLTLRAGGSESDLAARLPSAVLGVLSILATYLAGRQLLGVRAGLWAAALVALSPFHVLYAQEVNHYALAACLVALGLWLHLRALERASVWTGSALAITGLAALYAHYYAALALAAQGVELVLRHRRDPRRLAAAAWPYLVIAAGFAPYLPQLRVQLRELTSPAITGSFQGLGYFAERVLAIAVAPWLGARGEYLPAVAGVPLAALALVLLVAGLRSVEDRATRRVLLVNALVPPLLAVVVFWGTRSNSVLWSRYHLFFTFAQLLPVAALLARSRAWRWVAAPVLAALVAIGLRFTFAELVKEDWKGAAAAIASHGARDENVVVFRPNLVYALARYLPTENRLFGLEDGVSLPQQIAAAAEGRSAVWLVSAWAQESGLPASAQALLSCRYARRERFAIPPGRVGMEVLRYSEPYRAGAAAPSTAAAGARACGPAALAREPAAWELAAPGALQELAFVETPAEGARLSAATATVSGWAFSTRGIRSLRFEVDGREAGRVRHVGLPRPDVAAAFSAVPATHAASSGFWGVVELAEAGPGRHVLAVSVLHEDGTTSRLAERTFELGPPGRGERR